LWIERARKQGAADENGEGEKDQKRIINDLQLRIQLHNNAKEYKDKGGIKK